jgi:hypothetical protein
MNKIHEKSPCCNASIRLFGERRRQCSVCKKTWRVWKKNRGRKRNRLAFDPLIRYFEKKLNNSKLQKKTLSARLRLILKKFNTDTPWPKIPDGPLIVVADGLIEYFGNKKYAIYFILIRSISDSKAFIFPPYMHSGGEIDWHKAFEKLPDEIFNRICVLVCDGHSGLTSLAQRHQWKLQRCHFHLLYRIGHCASFGHLNKTNGIGLKIKNLVQVVLYHKDPEAISLAIGALQEIRLGITSKAFKTVISGFLHHYQDYRTYLDYPQYFLPTTSNTAEVLNSQIRDLQYRARGFRTPKSLFSWITGFCKYRKFITCRGKNQPN